MTDADLLVKYSDVLASYEISRDKARNLIKTISKASSAMDYHLPDFLTLNYQLSVPKPQGSRALSREHHFNMDEWPDSATLRSAMTEWHSAFVLLHKMWNLVPEHRRSTMQPPPQTLSPS